MRPKSLFYSHLNIFADIITPAIRIPSKTTTSFKCSSRLSPIHRPRIRVVTWVIGKTCATCWTASGTISKGTNTPERKSIRKRSMNPKLSAARTFGITLAITSPKAKKLKLLRIKPAITSMGLPLNRNPNASLPTTTMSIMDSDVIEKIIVIFAVKMVSGLSGVAFRRRRTPFSRAVAISVFRIVRADMATIIPVKEGT